MPGERWTGLKGKPESADMKFLLKQGRHRFPGPGYNTWHDRVLKEERGHQRLIRDKLNDYFAYHDEADTDPTLQGPMSPEGVKNKNNNKNNNNPETRPQSGSVLGTSILAKLAAKQGSNNGGDFKPGERAIFEDEKPISATRDRPMRKPIEIDEDKFSSLSEANQRRLFNIWPQVGKGWNDRSIQRTLYEKGRDVEGSPLRTIHSRPGSAASSVARGGSTSNSMFSAPPVRPSSGRNNDYAKINSENEGNRKGHKYNPDDYRFAPTTSREIGFGAPKGQKISDTKMFKSNSYRHSHSEVARGAASLMGDEEEVRAIAANPNWSYNRRVMAPANPDPVLSRRAESLSRAYAAQYKTTASREEESTHHLLKKINDLESELASQQKDRAAMQDHIHQLKSILLQQATSAGASSNISLNGASGRQQQQQIPQPPPTPPKAADGNKNNSGKGQVRFAA